MRHAASARRIAPEEAAGIAARAVDEGTPTPSARVFALLADLGEVLSEADGALLVTSEGHEDETHLVFLWTDSLSRAVRLSVLPPARRPAAADPACEFAGCDIPRDVDADTVDSTEVHLRALCAGVVLGRLLGCAGQTAFTVAWARHGLPAGGHRGFGAVDRWWRTTAWFEDHVDHVDLGYWDRDTGSWTGPVHDPSTPDEDDTGSDRSGLLGDPAVPDTGPWSLGDEMRPLAATVLSAEVARFRDACTAAGAGRDLAPFLVTELLDRVAVRVGGPGRDLMVWADASDDGVSWRDAEGVVGDHARRLLLIGPVEAAYALLRWEH